MYEHQRHGLRDHKSEKKLRQQVLLGHKQWFCQGPCMCNKIKAPHEHGNECLRIASTYGRSHPILNRDKDIEPGLQSWGERRTTNNIIILTLSKG